MRNETMVKYKIVRMYTDETHPDHLKIIKTGLTLKQAQRHCEREDTRLKDETTGLMVWFDGWNDE